MKSNNQLHSLLVLLFAAMLLALFLMTPAAQAHPPLGISMDDGSVSAPAYNFSADTDTGIYRIGANDIGVAAGGVNTLESTATALTAKVPVTFNENPILPSEDISPTNNATITPTKALLTLTNTSAVTVTLGACTTGQVAWLYNSTSNSVIITDTGNFLGAGNQTLGQYDAMGMICIGTKWVQTSAVSAN